MYMGVSACKYGMQFAIFLGDVCLPWILEQGVELGYITYNKGSEISKSISSMITSALESGAQITVDAIGRACHPWVHVSMVIIQVQISMLAHVDLVWQVGRGH